MLADRKSALNGWGKPLREALANEFDLAASAQVLRREGAVGAKAFAAGEGRGGSLRSRL